MVSEVDVERFDLDQPDSHMGSASMVIQPRHGDWVRYEDYAALHSQLAQAVKALRGAAEYLDYYSPLTGNSIETSAYKRIRATLAEIGGDT
jgi:hypothetical protein